MTQLKKLNFEEFDDESTQPTEEKVEEDKDDKPTKKTGKRRKQIARKGLHTDLDKDDSEDSYKASEKDDSTSGTKIPINLVLVAIKSPSMANYNIFKQGRKGVYQIIRENGTDMVYISFGAMLTDISRDDLTELYRIVMRKHGMNEPDDEFEKVLCEYLKNMLEEPLSTYSIWSLPVLMPRVVKSRDEIFSRWGYCDNHDLSRLDNQSIERDRLIGIGFVLNFVKFISFTFGDKEMISVIEAIIREVFVKLLLDSFGKLSISGADHLTDRLGTITEGISGIFEDMLKAFNREDLDTLWSLVKEKFRSVEPTEDMEIALWVELKRLYEPDKEDTL
ncbi:hypothetical protein Tco_0591291 [Tanacetum coccineum]